MPSPPQERFASPEPVAFPPETEVDATDFSPECPQLIRGPPSVYRDDAPELTIGHAISSGAAVLGEDCLSLCVWAPVKGLRGRIEIEEGDVVEGVPEEKRGLPVIVWITGGGFVVGGRLRIRILVLGLKVPAGILLLVSSKSFCMHSQAFIYHLSELR